MTILALSDLLPNWDHIVVVPDASWLLRKGKQGARRYVICQESGRLVQNSGSHQHAERFTAFAEGEEAHLQPLLASR